MSVKKGSDWRKVLAWVFSIFYLQVLYLEVIEVVGKGHINK